MHLIASNLGVFGHGLLISIQISVSTFVLAGLLGLLLTVARISPVLPLRLAATVYVELVRSIPLLVLLTLFVFGLPEIGLIGSLLWTAVAAMSLYWATFFSETLRSGVRAVPRGQIEAARALGLTFGQVLRIAVILNSSLAAAVGVTQELTGQTQLLDQQYAQPLTTFGAAAVCYVALTFLIGRSAGYLDRRLAVSR
jgi:glutamate transport system permease protein